MNDDIVQQLKDLNELYKSGVLTKEEFEKRTYKQYPHLCDTYDTNLDFECGCGERHSIIIFNHSNSIGIHINAWDKKSLN